MAESGPLAFSIKARLEDDTEVEWTTKGYSLPDALAGLFGLGFIWDVLPRESRIVAFSIRQGTGPEEEHPYVSFLDMDLR